MSTIRADNYSKRDGSSTISADTVLQGTAKAWFNLNGTGTIAARDSFNISSFTDNGTGNYTANFSNAQPNANYMPFCVGGGGVGQTVLFSINCNSNHRLTGNITVLTCTNAGPTDSEIANAGIMGDPT